MSGIFIKRTGIEELGRQEINRKEFVFYNIKPINFDGELIERIGVASDSKHLGVFRSEN